MSDQTIFTFQDNLFSQLVKRIQQFQTKTKTFTQNRVTYSFVPKVMGFVEENIHVEDDLCPYIKINVKANTFGDAIEGRITYIYQQNDQITIMPSAVNNNQISNAVGNVWNDAVMGKPYWLYSIEFAKKQYKNSWTVGNNVYQLGVDIVAMDKKSHQVRYFDAPTNDRMTAQSGAEIEVFSTGNGGCNIIDIDSQSQFNLVYRSLEDQKKQYQQDFGLTFEEPITIYQANKETYILNAMDPRTCFIVKGNQDLKNTSIFSTDIVISLIDILSTTNLKEDIKTQKRDLSARPLVKSFLYQSPQGWGALPVFTSQGQLYHNAHQRLFQFALVIDENKHEAKQLDQWGLTSKIFNIDTKVFESCLLLEAGHCFNASMISSLCPDNKIKIALRTDTDTWRFQSFTSTKNK